MINETTTLTSIVTVKDANDIDVQVAYLNATLDAGNMNMNVSVNTTNKVLAQANAATVKLMYDEFMTAVTARATDLGYVIF